MKKLLFVILFIMGLSAYDDITNKIEIIRVYDGDTFYINIEGFPAILGENIGIRINGIDTPEKRGTPPRIKKLARKAKEILEAHLRSAKVIELRNPVRGKYFRIVADVYVDGVSVAEIMLLSGLAKEYDGGTKPKW